MTASSVELFPCQVQLMGLPRSTSSAPTASTSVNLSFSTNRRPPNQKFQRVRRNLFGAPDRTELQNMYQNESERQRKYMLKRYNFDTKSSLDIDEIKSNGNVTNEFGNSNYTNSSLKPTIAYPTLIEQELEEHDQRRQCVKQNLCRSSLEETPSNTNIFNRTNRLPKIMRKCCEYTTTLSPAVDHQQPSTRQSLLTERLNIRKSYTSLLRNNKCYNVDVIATKSLEAQRNIGMPQILEDNTGIWNSIHGEDTKDIYERTCVESDKHICSTLACNDKSTAESLQVLASTQNL